MAIKTIKKSKIETEADLIRIRREIQIMSSVQHPNIIHIYEGRFRQIPQIQTVAKSPIKSIFLKNIRPDSVIHNSLDKYNLNLS